jgi:O-antigen polymerase
VPVGFFQQVNVLATYLATGMMVILYLISRPSFRYIGLLSKLLFVLTWGLGFYIIIVSGSRIGILSVILGLFVMVVCRRQQLIYHKTFMMVLSIVLGGALVVGQSGFERAVEKSKKITDVEYASARRVIYSVSLDLVKEKPLLGNGIGSFPKIWADKVSQFNKEHKVASVPQKTLTHPHNEVLFWFIEGGIISVIGIFIIIIMIGITLYHCGLSRGGAYASLILPISLHTQVEIPFYVSSVHWFLWLFLIFIGLRHQREIITIKLTKSARVLVQIVALSILLGGTAFMIQSQKAATEITKFIYRGKGNLQAGLNNLYFSDLAEKLLMQNLLNLSIREHNTKQIPVIIDWTEKRIQTNPELFSFILLSKAYGSVGKKKKQCEIAQKGLNIYTKNENLEGLLESCSK